MRELSVVQVFMEFRGEVVAEGVEVFVWSIRVLWRLGEPSAIRKGLHLG
jgi:hypothetical protein